MLLKEIVLQNFRSYGPTPTTIDLGRGISLFEGDIGSGKSTILYAIEFALFGLGELEAKYLLRATADTGRVALEIEVNGQEYTVVRAIDKKKGVKSTTIQTRGWIREPGEPLKELSPTELRSRILQILNFREKQSIRSSSRIFRYAIFTPQELMKDVLMQRPDERLETLRRAFGIEDYSFASTNTESVISQLDTRARIYEESAKSLVDKEKELSQAKLDVDTAKAELSSELVRLANLEKTIEETNSRLAILEVEMKRIIQLQSLIPLLESGLTELRRELTNEKSDLDRNKSTLSEIEAAERKLVSLKQMYNEYLTLKQRLRELDGLYQEQRYLSEEISKLSESRASKQARLKGELSSIEIQTLEISKKIEFSERELSESEKLETSLEDLRSRLLDLSELESRAEDISSRTGSAQALLQAKESELERARKKFGSLDGLAKESSCPLCGQPLNAEHLALVSKQFSGEIEELSREIEQYSAVFHDLSKQSKLVAESKIEYQKLQNELVRIERQLARTKEIALQRATLQTELDELSATKESLDDALKSETFAKEEMEQLAALNTRRRDLLSRLEDYGASQKRVRELEDLGMVRSYQNAELTVSKKGNVLEVIQKKEKRFSELEALVTSKGLELQERKRELEESEPYIFEQRQLKDQAEILQREYPSLKGKVERLSERVVQESDRISELEAHLATLRSAISKANNLKGVSAWLGSTFLPAIFDIERYVLASINEEFKDIFQRIFSKLVEESDLRVEVDDRFTPVVEQSGYELDVNSLSGGERTAVALAYRLALNYMVKRANEAMQANLLILDEPTEGFSPEQIYRFRNALEELASDQVIVVSHARDLEPISDRVYRVEKVNGESSLSVVA